MESIDLHFVGVVPARGGSKGIPLKNLVDLGGKPLMFHVIDAALAAGGLDRLVVSTEDSRIKSVAESRGIEVVDRPSDLAGDKTPTAPVLVHAVHALEAGGQKVDWVLILQPTYPFLRPVRVRQAMECAARTHADSVTTLTEIEFSHHPYNARKVREDGIAEFLFPEEKAAMPNRQSAQVLYRFGNLIVTRRRTLMEGGTVYGKSTAPVLIKNWEAMDIDDVYDLELCRFLFSRPDLQT
jgi:CMP-N-acetylneuraminic acid synthetase